MKLIKSLPTTNRTGSPSQDVSKHSIASNKVLFARVNKSLTQLSKLIPLLRELAGVFILHILTDNTRVLTAYIVPGDNRVSV